MGAWNIGSRGCLAVPLLIPQGSRRAMAWLRRLAVLLVSLLTAVRGETAPVLELVLARFNENLDWIGEIDACWNITVYNKGNNATLPKIRPYTSVDVPNTPGGRESETFLRHIIYRYDSLADYTVFSQGGPFVSAVSSSCLMCLHFCACAWLVRVSMPCVALAFR